MPDDFGRAVKWGCGLYIGWFLGGLLIVGGVAAMVFFCCGGFGACTMIGVRQAGSSLGSIPSATGSSNRYMLSNDATHRSPVSIGAKSADSHRQEDLAKALRQQEQRDRIEAEKKLESDRLAKERADRDQAAKEAAAKLARDEKIAGTLLRLAKADLDAGKDGMGGYNAGALADARKTLESLLRDYPNTNAAAEARKLLGSLGK